MKRYYISVDVGGTNCRIGLMESTNDQLVLVSQKKFHITRDFTSGIKELSQHIKEMAKGYEIVGIGGSFPGIIDSNKGIIVSSANLQEWQQQPIKHTLQKYLHTPVFIYHDVAAAAAGEALYGHGAATDTLVFLIWGTGFGGAKVEKFLGKFHITSFEPGHYVADRNGEICVCGKKGCPEINIGGGALTKRLGKRLADIADDDPIWDTVIEVAGQTVANVRAFHPTPLIVFGGGLILNRPFLLEKVKNNVQKSLFVLKIPELRISKLKDDAALYGAVALQKIELV